MSASRPPRILDHLVSFKYTEEAVLLSVKVILEYRLGRQLIILFDEHPCRDEEEAHEFMRDAMHKPAEELAKPLEEAYVKKLCST